MSLIAIEKIVAAVPPQHVGLMFSAILACGLDAVPAIKWLVTLNPLTLVSESLRGALTQRAGDSHPVFRTDRIARVQEAGDLVESLP